MSGHTLTPRSWSHAQLRRLGALRRAERKDPSSTWLGYWCSDQHGRPANHIGSQLTAAAGEVQQVYGPLLPCTQHALHATREPHRWAGCRVWIVALLGERVDAPAGYAGQKSAALRREIVGEVPPEDATDPRVGVRVGRLDMRGANLRSANLHSANLHSADLRGANLSDANLYGANLRSANLHSANLSDSYLRGANLSDANLYGANLRSADLRSADLSDADLSDANLSGADLYGAHRSADPPIPGWVVVDGRMRRET